MPFWEVPGFWTGVAAMVLFAAAATLAIAFGPGEDPAPEPEPGISNQDLDAIIAWGLTFGEWDVITNEGRAFYRDNITKAPHFAEILR